MTCPSTAAQGRICFYWYCTDKMAGTNPPTHSNKQEVPTKSCSMSDGGENKVLSLFRALEVRH